MYRDPAWNSAPTIHHIVGLLGSGGTKFFPTRSDERLRQSSQEGCVEVRTADFKGFRENNGGKGLMANPERKLPDTAGQGQRPVVES
jgi:hypothetical protein